MTKDESWLRVVARIVAIASLWLLLLLLVPFLLVCLLVYLAWSCCLHLAIWSWWCTRGRDVLLVYSDSPVWHDYIEANLLPHIRKRAIILNWSERRTWRLSLAVLAFGHFGGDMEFNPLAVVFRPFRFTRRFRFWRPFREYKHGQPEALLTVQRDFFDALGIQPENL
jgi:hypothetical protein